MEDRRNWTPATVANGVFDSATFGLSNVTAVSLSADTEVASIVFNPGASTYTITAPIAPKNLVISGAGIVNDSGVVQTFDARLSGVEFHNGATPENMISILGEAFFLNTSTAGPATNVNSGSNTFSSNASAENATIFAQAKSKADEGALQAIFSSSRSPLGMAFDGANIRVTAVLGNSVRKL